MTIYFISGLGADQRVFTKLVLPISWKIAYIQWPEISEEETIQSYAEKISAQINTTEEFSLIGLSFGGMIATELSKIIQPKRVIIISSVSTRKELPLNYKISSATGLYKLIPFHLFKRVSYFTYWLFGVETPEEKKLLKKIIHDTSPVFLKWAIPQIINWQNKERPQNLFHIHGTADRILPCANTLADIKIKGGGHLMVYNRAEEISKILIEELSN